MKVEILKHDRGDKRIEIHCGEHRIWVDYDDVDHKKVDKFVASLAKLLTTS